MSSRRFLVVGIVAAAIGAAAVPVAATYASLSDTKELKGNRATADVWQYGESDRHDEGYGHDNESHRHDSERDSIRQMAPSQPTSAPTSSPSSTTSAPSQPASPSTDSTASTTGTATPSSSTATP